jgi:hypothetical protein
VIPAAYVTADPRAAPASRNNQLFLGIPLNELRTDQAPIVDITMLE